MIDCFYATITLSTKSESVPCYCTETLYAKGEAEGVMPSQKDTQLTIYKEKLYIQKCFPPTPTKSKALLGNNSLSSQGKAAFPDSS